MRTLSIVLSLLAITVQEEKQAKVLNIQIGLSNCANAIMPSNLREEILGNMSASQIINTEAKYLRCIKCGTNYNRSTLKCPNCDFPVLHLTDQPNKVYSIALDNNCSVVGIYNGEFKNGRRDGRGILNYENGDIFVGQFIDNSLINGTYYYHDKAELYEGGFKDGLKEGQGILHYTDGSKREGSFFENKLKGFVVYTDSEGNTFNEYYIDGEKVEPGQLNADDIDDPLFQIVKIENDLIQIRKQNYTTDLKDSIQKICDEIKDLLNYENASNLLRQKLEFIQNELRICHKEYSSHTDVSENSSLYCVIEEIESVIDMITNPRESTYGWGPERRMYDNADFITYPTINSNKDNLVIGDERAFVHIKRHGENESYTSEISSGEKYDVRIYYCNNADSNIGQELGCARDVKISTYFPRFLKKNNRGEIGSTISSSNCKPQIIWAQRYIKTTFDKLYLRYIPGTATLHNNWAADGTRISDDLFTQEGAIIGTDELNGHVPGGLDYSGYIEYTIEAEERNASIIQTVSYDGVNYFDRLNAPSGSEIYFRITITNNGSAALTNVVVKGLISQGLGFIPGSVVLTANNSGIYDSLSDAFLKQGYNLGTVGTGNEINIIFRCIISDNMKAGDAMISSAYLVYDSETNSGDNKNAITFVTISNGVITPWGPDRKTYTNANPAPYVTFNSITDNAGVGDERNFVQIREANEKDKFANEIKISKGKLYEVYLYYQNDASPSLADTPKGIALDVRAKSSFPKEIMPQRKYTITGTISSSNALPESVWDGAYVMAEEKITLQYVPNSLRLHSTTEMHGQILDADEFFSKDGTLISAHHDNPGVITSKDGECGGHITYCLMAVESAEKEGLLDQPIEQNQDCQEVYSYADDISDAVFNAVVDNPECGDERQFVHIRARGEKNWSRCVDLLEGMQYEVEVFFRNDASQDYNSKDNEYRGVACKSAIAVDLPDEVENSGALGVRISGENKDHSIIEATDSIIMNTINSDRLNIRYIPGSSRMHNKWKTDGCIMPSSFFSYPDGTLIGMNDLNGIVPGGDEYSGRISFFIEVTNPQYNHSGNQRDTFTEEMPASYAVFNSITDNVEIGDERDFVKVREIGSENTYSSEIIVQPGKEYEIYVYYRNDASIDVNQSGYGVATNTRLSLWFPTTIKGGEKASIGATISWSYVTPDEGNRPRMGRVWDEASFISDDDVIIRYKAASAIIHNNGAANESVLSTNLFSADGTPIGYNKLGGTIPGGLEYSGYVTYTLAIEKNESKDKDEQASISLSMMASTDGGNYYDNITARVGDTIHYKVVAKNLGSIATTRIAIKDQLPVGLVATTDAILKDTATDGAKKTEALSSSFFTSNGAKTYQLTVGGDGWYIEYDAVITEDVFGEDNNLSAEVINTVYMDYQLESGGYGSLGNQATVLVLAE